MRRDFANISLKEKDRNAVEEAVELLKGDYPVSKVILFGSKACLADELESDIDLLVLTTRELPWREKDNIINSLFELQLKYDIIFDVLIVSEKEWNEGLTTVMPIHREIEENGVLV